MKDMTNYGHSKYFSRLFQPVHECVANTLANTPASATGGARPGNRSPPPSELSLPSRKKAPRGRLENTGATTEDRCGGKPLGRRVAAGATLKLVLDTQKPGYFRNRAICGR